MEGIIITQGRKLNVKEVTSNYTLTATTDVVLVNASITIEMLSATHANRGYTCKILNLCSSSCVASCMGSDTIEGSGTIEFLNQYDSANFLCATTNLYILI